MKILIDIKHPAHVHFFKNVIFLLKKSGNEVLVTARNKEMTLDLLDEFNIKYQIISSIGKNKFALLLGLFVRNYRFFKITKKFQQDIMLELMGVTAAPIGRILGIPTLVFYDTETAKLTNPFAYLFCTKFVTPDIIPSKSKPSFSLKNSICFNLTDNLSASVAVLSRADVCSQISFNSTTEYK